MIFIFSISLRTFCSQHPIRANNQFWSFSYFVHYLFKNIYYDCFYIIRNCKFFKLRVRCL